MSFEYICFSDLLCHSHRAFIFKQKKEPGDSAMPFGHTYFGFTDLTPCGMLICNRKQASSGLVLGYTL